MLESMAIRDRVESSVLQRIPPFPAAVVAVMRSCASEGAGAEEVARAVATEEVLAARIVRAANSAALAPTKPVSSVTAAVARLGSAAVRSLAAAYFLNDVFSPGFAQAGIERDSLWRHNLAVAAASAGAAGPGPERASAYFAGLMHDVGIMVLAAELGRHYGDCLSEAVRTGRELTQVEVEALGMDHAEAGAEAAAHWNFAPEVREAIRHHHQVLAAGMLRPIASYVLIGDQVAQEMGFAVSTGYGPLAPPREGKAASSVTSGILSRARRALTSELPRIEAMVNAVRA